MFPSARFLGKLALVLAMPMAPAGNYGVFHAKPSKPFRDRLPAERPKETFREFAEKHVDYGKVGVESSS